eukprot:TRINITY_DN721_c0_g4_i1.p1 TRINITY_DN721_c0_g4~~TRINITY_DN721_c0_g4_i1.p1  ORF type:complete len:156 (-),score=16.47 TRINITY_DN721_c0_g4_i1:222-689(-)
MYLERCLIDGSYEYKRFIEGTKDLVPKSTIITGSAEKPFCAENLADGDIDTYWQSYEKRWIEIILSKKSLVSNILMFVDVESDDSYSPKKFSIEVGNDTCSLEKIEMFSVSECCGWIVVPFNHRSRVIRITFDEMYCDGADVRVRGLKIISNEGK